jgi:hypothetical protein
MIIISISAPFIARLISLSLLNAARRSSTGKQCGPLEFPTLKCVEFAEELLYGLLAKKPNQIGTS